MKKLILASALVLGGLTTFAMATVLPQNTIKKEIIVEDNFKEIKTSELPAAVSDVLKKDFPTATLNKAYVNDKAEYKLKITVEGAESVVYADKDGNWIKK